MKKLALILAMAMIATVSFAGCGGSSSSSDTGSSSSSSASSESSAESSADTDASTASITGTYVPTTMTVDGTEMTYQEYVAAQVLAQGITDSESEEYNNAVASYNVTYIFGEDGALTVTQSGASAEGSYTYDGDSTVTVTLSSGTFEYTYDSSADTLTNTDANGTVTVLGLSTEE